MLVMNTPVFSLEIFPQTIQFTLTVLIFFGGLSLVRLGNFHLELRFDILS